MTVSRERIQEVARELFLKKGMQRTSLQEIADQLGITKPALYYHFRSREELVRSIIRPLIDDGEAFVDELEAAPDVTPSALLERYFDFVQGHHDQVMLVFTEPSALTELGVAETVLGWQHRLARVIFGPEPTLAQAVRAVVALGGVQDCTVQFPGVPLDELRLAAVNAATAALS